MTKKRCIRFHFYVGMGFGGWAVRTRLGSTISHVGMEFEDGSFYHSSFWSGADKLTVCDVAQPPSTTSELWVDPQRYEQALAFCEKQIGSRYDYRAMMGFLFTQKFQHEAGWFCSEYGRRCFEIATGIYIYWPKLCSPHELRIMVDTYIDKQVIDKVT